MIVKNITGCNDCPMCHNSAEGFVCKMWELVYSYTKEIEFDKEYKPITPNWCKLKENESLLLSFR